MYGPFSFCGHPSCPRLGRLPAGKSDLCNIWEFSQWPTRLAFQALEAEAQREASVPSVPVWAVFLQECSKDHLLQNQLGCDKCRFPGHAMRIWPGNLHFLNKLHKGLFCRLKFENYWSKAFFWISVLFLFLSCLLTGYSSFAAGNTINHAWDRASPSVLNRAKYF